MKRQCVATLVLLGLGIFAGNAARATETGAALEVRNVAPAFSGSGVSLLSQDEPSVDGFTVAESPVSPADNIFGVPAVAVPKPAAFPSPKPSPDPRFLYGSVEDFRWQLSIGYEFVRFRSAPITGNLNGLNAGVTYFTSNWFALEGSVVAAFNGNMNNIGGGRYLLFTGGPKIAWREHKLEPWAHALVGGLHMYPQTAYNGLLGFAAQIGGGVDWRMTPIASLRASADWVRSSLYSQSQNSFQIGVSFVYNF